MILSTGLILVDEPYYNEAGYEKQRGQQIALENSRVYNEMALLKLVEVSEVEFSRGIRTLSLSVFVFPPVGFILLKVFQIYIYIYNVSTINDLLFFFFYTLTYSLA